ncbi:MAG: GerAB/ArcD/ProY family transporter, partial [Lachnospiraceae bacterium]
MFSHNGKISEKQMRRMLVLPVFASVIFVLPYLSAQIFGKSVLPGVLVFFAFAILYVTCIYGLGKWQEKAAGGNISYLENAGRTGKCLAVIQLIRLLVRLTFYILLAVAILGEAQVPFMQGREADRLANLFVVLPLLLVALYGASRDVEKQGRIHEMVFWVMFIPFIIMILFGLYEVDYGVFKPRLTMSFGKIMLYGYALLTFILPVENYLYLSPDLRRRKVLVQKETDADGRVKGSHFYQKKQNLWISYLAVLFVVLLAVILTLFILGIYGVNGAGGEEMVTIAIMRYIRLPFGVLERFDVLMVWFFMTGCFILICDTLYYMGYLFEILFENVRKIWFQVLALAIALLLAAGLPDYTHSLMLFLFYGALLDIP